MRFQPWKQIYLTIDLTHFGRLLILTLHYFTLSIRFSRVDLILIDRLSVPSLYQGLKLIMQMLNSLLGGCKDLRSDCMQLANQGRCRMYAYPTLLKCPITCQVRCGKFFII